MVTGRFRWGQVERLISLGFHSAAGFTKEEFETLSPEPKKENALLVVSETCVNICHQLKLVGQRIEGGIRNDLFFERFSVNDHHNVVVVPRGLLYWIYYPDDGRSMLNLSTAEALTKLEKHGRRPCTTVEVLAMFRENPGILTDGERRHNIDAPGSRLGEDLMINLFLEEREQRITLAAVNPSETGYNRWGAASCEME